MFFIWNDYTIISCMNYLDSNIYMILFLLALIILIGIWIINLKTVINIDVKDFNLPSDLENYLSDKEAEIADIIPGTEKQIVWFDSLNKAKTPISIIYLHGFLSSFQDVKPLCELVSEKIGANIFYSRLTGHGRKSKEALKEATVDSWINDAVEALKIGREIGNKVVIIGTSTGGTLATWLSSYVNSKEILAVILISPNFGLKGTVTQLLKWPGAKYFVPIIVGEYRTWQPINEKHEKYWTTQYPIKVLFPMINLVRVVKKIDFNQINLPFLIFSSKKDSLVDCKKVIKFFDKLNSKKELVFIENSQDPQNHFLAGEILSPNTTGKVSDKIVEFINSVMEIDQKN